MNASVDQSIEMKPGSVSSKNLSNLNSCPDLKLKFVRGYKTKLTTLFLYFACRYFIVDLLFSLVLFNTPKDSAVIQ